tara:strand:+ start:156 stop:479 length:324 start_codon:yes stop_codon:yes gene_type:complete
MSDERKKLKERWLKNIGHTVADKLRECIICGKGIQSCAKTKSLIGGVELISYATWGSRHDYTYNDFNRKQIAFCICDDCYEKNIEKGIIFVNIRNDDFLKPKKEEKS